ncbi:exonuclease mut-7-like protein [Leptotrombidium deliense]|uniref:Exonuclease mut-7-like protein n=1 Tax=Leptotrombidium deliense TaxID=299467 RepID=A0A443RZB2_9ACAR|nr:exonuclease mut-7-like protein [Leptotrombidium deliense]
MLGALNVSSVQMVELMQIATWDDCFLIDVQQLKDSESQWIRVCNHIFNSQRILKIGFGIKSDWANIKATLPKNVFTQAQNVVDFSDFSEWLFLKYPDMVDKNKDLLNSKDAKGLSKLTYLVLGKFINKEEQFSDWGRRPLRDNQIKYAAIDAYSLLQIYEQLFEKSSKMGINFEEVIQNYVAGKISAEEKLSLKSEFALNTIENIEFPVTAIRHFKCIADTMVQGLGKNLRVCGADVWILEGNEYDQEVCEYSDNEDALILTTGHRFDYWKNKVNPGKCCRVSNTLTANEQMKVIITRFNLRITEKDLLSRCVKCNCNEFEQIPSSALRNLYLKRVKTYRDIPLKFEGLHISKFDSISVFWICVQCGQIYWEGCHHDRLKRKLQELLFPVENEEMKDVNDSPGKKIVVPEVITIDDD